MSSQSGLTNPLEASLVENDYENMSEEAEEYVKWMDSFGPNRRKYFESLGEGAKTSVPLIEQPPKMEQKPLPSHLKYAYLRVTSTLPVLISASLIELEEENLLRVLRDHRKQKCSRMVSRRFKRDSPFHVHESYFAGRGVKTFSGSTTKVESNNERGSPKGSIKMVRYWGNLSYFRQCMG